MKRKLAAVFLAAALVVSGGSMAWAAEGEEDAGQVNIEERTDSNVKKMWLRRWMRLKQK